MKQNLMTIGLLAAALTAAQATVYEYNFTGATEINAALPDGNPVGYVSTISVSGTGNNDIRDVNVFLNISGGYSGDLYGYLVNPNGDLALLLNRIGSGESTPFGNSGAGINVTLDDAATVNGDIHNAADGAVSGSWQADGGLNLAGLNNAYANGTWTLFLADMANGDMSTLVSWGLQIDVVPEPATWALLIFGGLLGGGLAVQELRRRHLAV